MKVKDDDIIRISYNINSYMDFASMFIAPMLIAAAIGIIAGLIAVSSVARQIMKPINSISKAMSGMKYVGDEKSLRSLTRYPRTNTRSLTNLSQCSILCVKAYRII